MKKPNYEGKPLAAMTPLPMMDEQPYPRLWLWSALWYGDTVPHTLEAISQLVMMGYKQSGQSGPAVTQLYEVVRAIDEQAQKFSYWYAPTHHHQLAPVTLVFSIESNPSAETIPLLSPVPLPQLGEYGLVDNGQEKLEIYHIFELKLEARQRWAYLGDLLRRLSAPLLWPAFTERHLIASNELIYQREMQALLTQQELAIRTETRFDYILKQSHLRAAHLHIEELQRALTKDDWLDQWKEVQRMAQELAKDYYDHHQEQTAANVPTQPEQSPLPLPGLPAEQKQKKERKTRVSTTRQSNSIVTRDKEYMTVRSDAVYQQIVKALRDKGKYKIFEESGAAEYRQKFYKDKGQIIITIRPGVDEPFEVVIHALNTLGDECIDTYVAVMAIALERNGTDRVGTPFTISPDEILEVRRRKKSNGSYTPNQRAEVIAHLKTLSLARVVATMPGKPAYVDKRGRKHQGTVYRVEGALIDLLSFKIGEYKTITGEDVWEKRSIAIGQWATMIPELNNKTAIMLRQVLAYSAKNERYQKRLGLYLTFMFRVNARNGGRFPNGISMHALLEGAGIVAPRQQGEFKEALEHALAQLKAEGVIGDFWQIVESSPAGQEMTTAIHQHARGWFDLYLQTMWNFSPPATVAEQYQKLLKAAPEDDAENA